MLTALLFKVRFAIFIYLLSSKNLQNYSDEIYFGFGFGEAGGLQSAALGIVTRAREVKTG